MPEWRTILGLLLSSFGVLASFSSVAFLYYENYHAAVWAIISGILAAIDLHLLVLHYRRTLNNWHTVSTIGDFKVFAFQALTLGVAATVWYIFMFLYYNMPILPVPESYQIAAVWSFMAAKWGLGLWLTVRHLQHQLQEGYIQLPIAQDNVTEQVAYFADNCLN